MRKLSHYLIAKPRTPDMGTLSQCSRDRGNTWQLGGEHKWSRLDDGGTLAPESIMIVWED